MHVFVHNRQVSQHLARRQQQLGHMRMKLCYLDQCLDAGVLVDFATVDLVALDAATRHAVESSQAHFQKLECRLL